MKAEISKSEFAKRQEVSRARVSQYLRDGIIHALPNGRIDLVQAEADLKRNLDHSKKIDWDYRISGGGPQKRLPNNQQGPFAISPRLQRYLDRALADFYKKKR